MLLHHHTCDPPSPYTHPHLPRGQPWQLGGSGPLTAEEAAERKVQAGRPGRGLKQRVHHMFHRVRRER